MNSDQVAENCIFCKIVAGELPCHELYSDEHTLAFMDINPAADGHSLVIPKIHSANLFETSNRHFVHVIDVVQKVAVATQKALKPDGLNIAQANGPGAAQSVMHFHFHVLPRTMNDNLKMNWEIVPGEQERIAGFTEQIRGFLEK